MVPMLVAGLASAAAAEDDKELLANISYRVRAAAAERLAVSGAKDAVPELAECLVDGYASVRSAVLIALGRAGPDAKSALPEVRRCFLDKDPGVGTEAHVAAARIGAIAAVGDAIRRDKTVLKSFSEAHHDVLRSLLESKSWHVRLWVLEVKHVYSKPGPEWTAPLAKLATTDPAQAVRYRAAIALLRSSDAAAAKPLLACLDDRDAHVRLTGLAFVSRGGPSDPAMAVRIEALLQDPDDRVRAKAIYALRGRDESRAKIDARLDDKSKTVRLVAASLFASQGRWPRQGGGVGCDRRNRI